MKGNAGQANGGRTERLCYGILAAVFAGMFLLMFRPYDGVGCDQVFYYGYLASPLFDGDFDIMNEIWLAPGPYGNFWDLLYCVSPTGAMENRFAIGSALFWLPFYLPVRAVGWLHGALAAAPGWSADRFSEPYLLTVSLAAMVYGFLTVLLVYRTCRFEFRPGASVLAALGAVLASPLAAYIFSYPVSSHAQSAFCAALLLYLCYRYREFPNLMAYLLLALVMGLATITRWQNLVFAVIPLGFWIDYLIGQGRALRPAREAARIAAGCAVFAVVCSLQCVYWWAVYGDPLTMPQGQDFMQWTNPHFYDLLFNGWHGLFYFHPFLLAAFAGMAVFLWRRKRSVYPYGCVLAVLLTVYVNAAVEAWWTGMSYACRKFDSSVPVFALGLAALWSYMRGRRLLIPAAATGAAILLDVVLQTMYTRNMFDIYYLNEVWALRSDVARHLPRWLLTIPLNGYVGSRLALTSNWAGALAVALAGLAAIGGAWALARQGAFGWIERRAPALLLIFAILVLAIDAAIYARGPEPDPRGSVFLRARDPGAPLSPAERVAILEQLIRDGYGNHNPAVYACAYECSRDSAALRTYLAAARRTDPALWARWVTALPPECATANERAEARALARPPVPDAVTLYLNAIGREVAAGNTRRQRALTNDVLHCNPFLVSALEPLYRTERSKGNSARASEMRGRLRRYLEARVENYFRVESTLGRWKTIPYSIHYHLYALMLGRMYEEEREFGKALALYENIDRVYGTLNLDGHWRKLIMRARVAPSGTADTAVFRELDRPDVPVEIFASAGRQYVETGQPSKAALILTVGLRHYPMNRGLGYWMRLAIRKYPPGRLPFEALMAADLESPEYWGALAEMLFEAGRFEEGLALADRALRRRPDDPWLLYLKGYAACELGRYAEAEGSLRRAFELAPDHPSYGTWFGRVLIRLKRFDEARAALDRALAANPKSPELATVKAELEQAERLLVDPVDGVDPVDKVDEGGGAGRAKKHALLSTLSTLSTTSTSSTSSTRDMRQGK